MKKNILIIGSGGREDALRWAIEKSEQAGNVYVAPGNGKSEQLGISVPIQVTEFTELLRFVEEKDIYMTIVGPEVPLAAGIVDVFRAKKKSIFGPTAHAALLESSKSYAKHFMRKADIPTASFEVFEEYAQAEAYVLRCHMPVVVKSSGLKAGKGVTICHTTEEALKAALGYLQQGERVVIEEYVSGEELSAQLLCYGEEYLLLPFCRDYQTLRAPGTPSPNTGGMGSYAPVLDLSSSLVSEIETKIIKPTLRGLQKEGALFTGCLYPGLKLHISGVKVLEYNARFGDPEVQSLLRLLYSNLIDVLDRCIDGALRNLVLRWRPGFAVCVVLASKGYPENPWIGFPIYGIEEAEQVPGVVVFHAGTTYQRGKFFTAGGRVLNVTAWGKTLREAIWRAYEAVTRIHFEGMQYRLDIGS